MSLTPSPTRPADDSRRQLTRDECEQLLRRPVVGVLSTLAPGGWIHSVPVHFLYRDDEVRILAGLNSVKARNIGRTGRATLCVDVVDGSDRRYVSIEGAVRIEAPPAQVDLLALDQRYVRTDFSAGSQEDDDAVMLVLAPSRWIAWADWD